MKTFLDRSGDGLSQSHFNRMLALGCFDILITLPIGAVQLALTIRQSEPLVFYRGWTFIHTDWDPILFPERLWSMSKWTAFVVHWNEWLVPLYAVVFFPLFGLTPVAKEGCRKSFRFLFRRFGAKQEASSGGVLTEVVFKSVNETSEITSKTSRE